MKYAIINLDHPYINFLEQLWYQHPLNWWRRVNDILTQREWSRSLLTSWSICLGLLLNSLKFASCHAIQIYFHHSMKIGQWQDNIRSWTHMQRESSSYCWLNAGLVWYFSSIATSHLASFTSFSCTNCKLLF